MVKQIEKILDKINYDYGTLYTPNFAYANTNLDFVYNIEQQQDWKEVLNTICEYLDHIWLRDGTTIWFIDTLIGISPTVMLGDFDIVHNSINSKFNGTVATKLRAEWTVRYSNNKTNTLDTKNKEVFVSTGITGGSEVTIPVLDYRSNKIQEILERKRTLMLKQEVNMTLAAVHPISVGQQVSFTTQEFTGSFITTKITWNTNSTQSVTGIGTLTYL